VDLGLLGIHHVTAITADAARNVDFYARVLGLRLVKKTVNYDAPDVYHLYYGDEGATPGSLITFFEFPGAARGTTGSGAINLVQWRVASVDALAFWEKRLAAADVATERAAGGLNFADPDGMRIALVPVEGARHQVARAADVPDEVALRGILGVAALTAEAERSRLLLHEMEFSERGAGEFDLGPSRLAYAHASEPAVQGAGSVHHVAWACRDQDQVTWRERLSGAGATVTPIIDRTYFHSIYFREPSGVLFEIATLGPGFAVDEAADALGESLVLPPRYEPLRSTLEQRLTPISNPRGGATVG